MFQALTFFIFLAFPRLVFAQKFLVPDLKLKLSDVGPDTLGEFISEVYHTAIPLAGTIAVVLLLWGGLKWISAGGNPSQVEAAKETIYSALLGLLLAIGSYALLYTVNPELVNLKSLNISKVGEIESTQLKIASEESEQEQGHDPGSDYIPSAGSGRPVANMKGISTTHDNDNEGLRTGSIRRKDGKMVPIDQCIIQCLEAMQKKGIPVTITSLVGGHSEHVAGSSRTSRHWNGAAFDTGNDPRIAEFASTECIKFGVRQVITGSYRQYNTNGGRPFSGFSSGLLSSHRNHIHIGC